MELNRWGSLGAKVIKVKDLVGGDSYPEMTTQYGDIMLIKSPDIGFETANLNKKCITLNLKYEKGKQIL